MRFATSCLTFLSLPRFMEKILKFINLTYFCRLMGERVAEEELGKSKILSLFEADINNKKIKTFFNGVAGVLEDRQKQDRIFQEEKMFIIHPLSSFRYKIFMVYI